MHISHLASLRDKKRRERLEWLGDAVMEEAIVRLVVREALVALEREEVGINGGHLPETLRPISQRLGEVLRLAVSNINLSAVYSAELVGLVAFLGLGHDEHDHPGATGGGRLCRSDSFGPPSAFSASSSSSSSSSSAKNSAKSPKKNKTRDKQQPDLVESAIGEAFEASLGLVGGGGAGSGRVVTPLTTLRSQRFAGRHRAALVDRLLSSALSTETIRSFLESPDHWTGDGGGGVHDPAGVSGTFTNSFSALDTDEEKQDREDEDDEEDLDSRPPSRVSGDSSSSVGDDVPGEAPNAGGVSATPETTSARCPCPSTCSVQARREDGDDGIGGLAGRARDAETIAAARENVLRLYGAALLKFRVTVFLFCCANSAAAAAATAAPEPAPGDEDEEEEQGPRELTMRRQRVMCAENLEAVAEHLQSLERDNEQTAAAAAEIAKTVGFTGGGVAYRAEPGEVAKKGSPPSAAAVVCPILQLSPPNWLRVAVGRAALDVGGDHSPAFSARVAALLLSRSGERGGPPQPDGGDGDYGVVLEGSGAPERGGEGAIGDGARAQRVKGGVEKQEGRGSTWVAAAAAAAEMQFRRDSWPDTDLPRASAKASQLCSPRSKNKAGAGAKNTIGVSHIGRASFESSSDGGLGQVDGGGSDDDQQPPPSPPRRGIKRKRAQPEHGSSSSADGKGEDVRLPPHYAGLMRELPRESRQLLSRLGHHGYVKVLEELLGRFLRGDSAAAVTSTSLDTKPPTTRVVTTLGRALTEGLPIDVLLVRGLPPPPAEEEADVASINSAAADSHDQLPVQRREDAALDTPDPWRALQIGRAHPSLCGLVEPPELARAGPERMVLPMPSPFYRRVLHALCLAHGLCSRGGETAGGGSGSDDGAVVRHRTVEVTRTRSVGSDSDSDKRRRSEGAECGAAVVVGLIPVETLLGTGR